MKSILKIGGAIAAVVALVLTLGACGNVRINEHDDWKEVFDKYGIKEGSFEYYDNNREQANYYNKAMTSQPYTPASTFKIFNSLVALETNAALDENMVIKYDGIRKLYIDGKLLKPGEDTSNAFTRPEWNQDLTMKEAFKVSSVPYYQEIARRIGKPAMQKYLDTVKYGNMKIGDKIDEFWLNDTLKISPDEQVGLMKRLYHDELPFSARAQRIVKDMMLQEKEKDYELRYKTGTGIDTKTKEYVIWIVGYAEVINRLNRQQKDDIKTIKEDAIKHPYFFALCYKVPKSTNNIQETRLKVLHDLLTKAGIHKY